MDSANCKSGPRVGPRDAGESHPSASAEGCPSYYGVGNNCAVGQQTADSREHELGEEKRTSGNVTTAGRNLSEEEVLTKTKKTKPYFDVNEGETLDSDDSCDRRSENLTMEESDCSDPMESIRRAERELARSDKVLRVSLSRLSDSDSVGSLVSVPSPPTSRLWRKRRGDRDVTPDSDHNAEPASLPGEVTLQAKRGRGRPPTTGKYIGVGKARQLLNAAITREQQLDAEEEAERMAIAVQKVRRAHEEASPLTPPVDLTERPAAELNKMATDSLAAILDVASKSKNLKGGFVRTLKQSADNLKLALTELGARTKSDEVARLEVANARLAGELAQLREEVAQLRRRPAEVPPTDTTIQELLEQASRRSIEQFGTMLNARLEAIECRLLPAPILRPPLAADRRAVAPASSTHLEDAPSSGSQQATQASSGRTKKKKTQKRKRATLAAREAASKSGLASAPVAPSTRDKSSAPPVNEGAWSQVAKRKPPPKKKAPAKATPRKRKPRPPRVPRSAAVTLTLQPGAVESGVTYAKVLADAMSKIDPKTIGINSENIRFRATKTEARMFEVFGAESKEKADSLAAKFREVMSPDVVRIARPSKCCDIRITGLFDSATADNAVEAVAKYGGCDAGAIRAGSLSTGGTLWLSCPVAAAKKLAKEGRLQVGWVSARVTLLDPKPLRCYRCLEPGHVGALCKGETDRSGLCYRCGEPGHTAKGCTANKRCVVCAAAGRPATHALGGKGCLNGAPKTVKGGTRAPKPKTPPAQEKMDVAPT